MVDRHLNLPVRVRIALILLLLGALVSLRDPVRWLTAFLRWGAPQAQDAITGYEHRLAPLRAALLARGATDIGYLARPALRGDLPKLTSDPRYIWTCYALAPIMVLPDTSRPIVFADLKDAPLVIVDGDRANQGRVGYRHLHRSVLADIPPDLEVMQSFGDSLFLLRPAAP